MQRAASVFDWLFAATVTNPLIPKHAQTRTYKRVLSAGMVAASPTANQNARCRARSQ